MKVALSTIAHLLILFILPLSAKPALLLYPQVILSAVVIVLLLTTQPQMKMDEASRDRRTDKGTILLIALCSVVGHVLTISEWAYFPQLDIWWLPFLGASLLIGGIIFRIIAIKILDKAFSSTLQIKKGQNLITKGLYSKFRHPSYTGAWVLMLGDALIFQSYAGIAILGIGMFIVYMKRIQTEEEMLLNEFGMEYEQYMAQTWKFLPGY
ncbi:hypothetical protein FUAX_45420 (plasmid) [Fulvitalea axinellae]|uniref:Isoprenylcysteine carboxylmethyltransferase family protein n=1 Tax=Fulvitalea axinellae TaxID=1182444 RepID=A0AAU9CRV6_9BACT|nr:hypothetical protein FUAX_45420 [Fulvitalea axinellae]